MFGFDLMDVQMLTKQIADITIRPATESDYTQLCHLFEELDEYHRREQPDIFRIPDGPRREFSFISSIISNEDSTIIVAENSVDEVVGLVMLIKRTIPASVMRGERDFCEMDSLVVSPDYRCTGVGRLLVADAVKWSRLRGLTNLEASVWDFNKTALSFYASQDFQISTHRIFRNTM